MSGKDKQPPPGKRKVIVRWITHPKTKQRIYPRNGSVFVFYVDDNPKAA
jgi:hypothetical protein